MTEKTKFQSFVDVLFSEKTFFLYAVSCMVVIPLGEFITELMGILFVSQPIIFSVYGLLGAFLVAGKMAFRPSPRHWSDVFFFTSLIFMFISLIFSKDIARAVRNDPNGTNEYAMYFVAYYCLMFAGFQLRSIKYRKVILYILAALSFLEGIIGVFQMRYMSLVGMMHGKMFDSPYVYGLTQNSNYYGCLSVLFVGACIGCFFFLAKKLWQKIVFALMSLFAIYVAYGTMARACWIAIGILFVVYGIIFTVKHIKHKENKEYSLYMKIFYIGLGVCIAGAVLFYFLNSEMRYKVDQTFSEISQLGTGYFIHFGSGRGYLWQYCLEAIPKNWVVGVGLDNLYYAFTSSDHWIETMYYSNRAHNTFLHILTTQGVFGFANYIALLVFCWVNAAKRISKGEDEDSKITWIFFAMFVAYLFASFFNCRVFNVELYFYILLGAMVPRASEEVKING